MLNTSLLEILRTLNREEIKKYGDMVQSPYFNKKSNVTKLFNRIKRFYPEFKSEKLRKENIWKELFPSKEFNYGIMKNLIYDLQKLSETFLELNNYEKNLFQHKFNHLEELFNKNLDGLFEKNLRIYEDSLSNSKIGENYFADMLKLEWLKLRYYCFKKRSQEIFDFFGLFNEYLMSDFMRQFFITNINIIRLRSDFKFPEKDINLIKQIVDYISGQKFKYTGIILMYYNAFMLMVNSDDETLFFQLKKLVLQNSDKLDYHERFNIYTVLTNYCIARSQTGREKFEKEEFELYKIILDKKAFAPLENGYINFFTYYNIARLASKLGNFDWAYDFVKKFESKLMPEQREHSYFFTLAFIEFEKGDFVKSLEHISKLKHTGVREKPRLKMLYMMIYFEQGHAEQLFSLIDTSKHFAKKDSQLSDEYMHRFSNFVSIVNKIAKIKFDLLSESEKEFILLNIKKDMEDRDFPNKYWLINKIKELERNNSGKRHL